MVDWKKPIAVRGKSERIPARVICTDRRGRFPYVVLVTIGGEEYPWYFREDGTNPNTGVQVVNVPETRTIWRAFMFRPDTGHVTMVYNKDRTTLEKVVRYRKSGGYLIIEDIHKYAFEVPTCAD